MNVKPNSQTTMKTDVWQNYIVEELSDEAQSAVSGGGGEDWEIYYNRAMKRAKYTISAETHATSPEESLKSYYANPGAFIG
jgi:hypothetical protein